MTDDSPLENEDDGLSIVDESASESEPKYQLQPEAQFGLKFVPEVSQTGSYSLRLDSHEPEESNINLQHGSANDAPTVNQTGDADIYAIAESPSENPAVHPSVPPTERTKSRSRTAGDSLSLEELYERKRLEQEEHAAEKPKRVKRAELPERPFWDNLLTPFTSYNTLFRLGLVSAAAFLPLLAVTHFFTRTLAGDVQQMLVNRQEISALAAFFSCIWRDKIVLLMLCFLWGVLSTPYSFHIFTETASGADKFDDWPEYSFLGGLVQFLWGASLILLAGIPGAFVFGLLHLSPLVGFAFTATCLTPVFFLSCMQADALYALITKEIAASFKRVTKSWLYFVAISFCFLFSTIGLTVAAIGFDVHNYVKPEVGETPGLGKVALVAFFFFFLLSFVPALYLRVLGRLAWIIEADMRKRSEEQDADSKEEEEEEA